jgi:hypothetical protein
VIDAACRILVRVVGLADVALAASIVLRATSSPLPTVLFAWLLLTFGALLVLFVEAVIP